MKDISNIQLKLARTALGLATTDFDTLLDIHRNTIMNIEKNTHPERDSTARKKLIEYYHTRGIGFIENGVTYS